ncbi:hypothetical protein F5B20DRAFT_577378 [Whalleya microplaca]|nr:hypothetical protein F5B20DRAFT_577378 [Whalleya microplaca]
MILSITVSRHQIADKLGCTEDRIVEILPVTEFQQHSIKCAELRPQAEWGFFSMDMNGVSVSRLRKACAELYDVIEIFRTVFVSATAGSALHAVVMSEIQPDIRVQEVQGSVDAAMQSFFRDDLARGLSPDQSLTAFSIFHKPLTNETRLIMQMSHAHYDGISLALIADTLAALYKQGAPPRLGAFSQFIHSSMVRTAADYQYWREILRGGSMSVGPHDLDGCNDHSGLMDRTKDQFVRGLLHESLGLSEIVKHCTDWSAETSYGSTVHYQNVAEDSFALLEGNRIRLDPVQDSGEADAPGCTRVTAYPTGSECKLEISMPPKSGVSMARKVLEDLAASIEILSK